MMPPEPGEELTPPTGDIAPDPDQALDLGAGNFLLNTGAVVQSLRGEYAIDLEPNMRKFWEAAAMHGQGKTLDELMN